MRKIWSLALVFCLLLTGCGRTSVQPIESYEPAQEETEVVAPEEAWENAVPPETEVPSGGLYLLESVPTLDADTENLEWVDKGDYRQSVLWSPNGSYVAIARASDTEAMVTVIEPVKSAYWHMTMPDGTDFPENICLPEENWGQWMDETTLNIVVGGAKGGDEMTTYRCMISQQDGQLTGSTFEQTTRTLTGAYDFDHDGLNELMELVTVLDPSVENLAAIYELRISKRDGTPLWMESAHWSHAGWTSIFACEINGQDYLLRYQPYMSQGWAQYSYKLFSLDGANPGYERTLRESTVVWDDNFQMDGHQFHAAALADFLTEVRGYLEGSSLLMSTENGEFRISGRGAEFDDGFLEEWQAAEGDPVLLEELLAAYELAAEIEQGLS